MFARQRQRATEARQSSILRKAFAKFKPRKTEHGNVVFITKDGRRGERTGRVGFAVYVDRRGKKHQVRQYDRRSKKVETVPTPRKISSIDVSRVKSAKARQQFLTSHLNPIAAGKVSRVESKKLVKGQTGELPNGTRFKGGFPAKAFFVSGSAVEKIARELLQACQTTKGARDFLVTIGLTVETKSGESFFITTQRRFVRQPRQKLILSEMTAFLGYEVYAFLAHELTNRGLTLQGSAQFVSRLPENKGKKRNKWTKDGFLWEGHDSQDVRVFNVEYRFDQISFQK